MDNAIYQAHILDHAQRPRNKGVLEQADVQVEGSNPSCGDTLTLYLAFDGNAIVQASFTGEGCVISQAANSMLTEKIKGMSIEAVQQITEKDIYKMLGVTVNVGREKCALLAYRALQSGLTKHA